MYGFALSGDGNRIAVTTAEGIVLCATQGEANPRLVLKGAGSEESRAPYSRLRFSPDGKFVTAIGLPQKPFTVVGQGPGVVAFIDGGHVALGVSTPEVVISPDGTQVAASVWQHSPVGIERPGGLKVWGVAALRAGDIQGTWALEPAQYIAGVHTYPGCAFWLHGRLTCVATALAPEPGLLYRRFGTWQVAPPRADRFGLIGPMPKRFWPCPGPRGRLFWRYAADPGMFLLDEVTGRCLRFDDALNARHGAVAVTPDLKRLILVAKNQVIVHELREEPQP